MLKWLRKYNTYILVVGGSLLMVAFLLPETIMQLGRSPIGGAALKIDGSKVSHDRYDKARMEHYAITSLLGRDAGVFGAGENTDHWIMLTREAERAGLIGGRDDGAEFLPQVVRDRVRMSYAQMAQFMARDQIEAQIESQSKQAIDGINTVGIPRLLGETRLTEDEVYRALGKLHGVVRLRKAYFDSAGARMSPARLVKGMKTLVDSAKVDAVFVPPEREFAAVTEPDDAAVQAQFERFKSVKPGEGEFGVGYLLPERVKLAWLTLDPGAIQPAIVPDPVMVRRKFLGMHPTGTAPSPEAAAMDTARFEADVRAEGLAKVMRAADQAIKAEFERATRKLEPDGEYKKLPEDWAATRPDFTLLPQKIVDRVREMTGTTIPLPTAVVRDAGWLTREEVAGLPGIGATFLRRGDQSEAFADVVFRTRELAGPNDSVLQAGVPSVEFATDGGSARHYFMVLDAKKESAPDEAGEIRERVVRDIKRMAAFELLKGKIDAFRAQAVTPDGLATIAGSGTAGTADQLPIRTGVMVNERGLSPDDASLNTEEFRRAVSAAAAGLDPTVADLSAVDPALRTVVVALPKSLGLGVARITAVTPTTEEQFRTMQRQAAAEMLRRDTDFLKEDPFSLARMEKRLKVEYTDGRTSRPEEAPANGG